MAEAEEAGMVHSGSDRRSLARRFLALGSTLVLLMAGGAGAREVVMVAPEIPPHFDANGNGRIGDVVRAALKECGHSVSFRVVPFGRHWEDYRADKSLDGLATAEADQVFPGTSTAPFMHLQDGATVPADGPHKGISGVEALRGARVVAFPNADKILGIQSLVPEFASFATRANRFDQLRPLFAGRADAVLADGLITAHFAGLLRQRVQAGEESQAVVARETSFRRIFAPGPQRLYFRDAGLAADFDRCFALIKGDGRAERLAEPYLRRYQGAVGDQYPVL